MTKIINVPQGCSAELSVGALLFDINGLYTDGFGTCNIAICISQFQVKLIHVDFSMMQQGYFTHEVASMYALEKVLIIHRAGKGDLIKKSLLESLKITNSVIVDQRAVEEQIQGVLVTISQDSPNTIKVNLQYLSASERPQNLLHHPQEQIIEAVQKMRPIIGVRHINRTRQYFDRRYCIYGSLGWSLLTENEKDIKANNPVAKQEMEMFSLQDSHTQIASKLFKIVQLIEEEGGNVPADKKDVLLHCLDVAVYVEGYLHDFKADEFLKRDLNHWLSEFKPVLVAKADFVAAVQAFLEKNETNADELIELINIHEKNVRAIAHGNRAIDIINELLRQYKTRSVYSDIAKDREEWRKSAGKFNQLGLKAFRGHKFIEAIDYFVNTTKYLTWSVDVSNPDLIIAYYNTGRSYQKNGEHNLALVIFKMAKPLLESNVTQSSQVNLAKLESAISECEGFLQITRASSAKGNGVRL